KDNLYAWHAGTTSYVATLVGEDNKGGLGQGDWNPAASLRSAEASPNGRWLGFLSKAQLTGYDNTGPCEIIASGPPVIYGSGPCPEAFLFDSTTGQLSCASCNPTLLPPLGPTTLRLIDGAGPALPQPRYLSDSGRLFFDTQDSLSPFDTNEGVEDVYELEPTEVGDCKRQAGCVSLISAGAEGLDSNFLAADPSGKNVFFTTRDRLSQRDRDELIDLYDAREKGGIPAESEPARGECQGEACQPLASSPNDPTPGSSSFQGAGNLTQQSCAKARVKRRGRCTKPRSRHHRRHHRSAPHGRKGR
ncbi:MAG TPA: hypothetical protein VGD41_20370, partial [Pyrinomonadaceae bacterium]